jgi:hypothetical protein
MFILYLFCLFPLLFWVLLAIFKKDKFNVKEAVIGSLCSFSIAGIIHWRSFSSQTEDTETLSGQIVLAKHYSEWFEYYEYAVYRTEYYSEQESYSDSKGKTRYRTVRKSRQVFDHWQPTTRWHSADYAAYSNINTSYSVSREKYFYFVKNFGNETAEKGEDSRLR